MVERIIMCIKNHVQHLGITEPISLGGPTEHDVMQTHELEKFLADADLYESHEESIGREEVLGRLDQIVKIWVKTISRAKGLNEQLVQEANAKIFTFGSYRLGVDESVHKLDSRVPPAVKQLSSRALIAAQDAPATARAVVSEVKNVNLVDTASGLAKTAYAKCDPAAKGMYMKYEPVAKQYAASTWHSLNQLPLFPRVAQVVVPTAAYCSEKYNETVQRTAKQGYKVSSYLPLVPTEKIAKVFSGSNSQTEMIDTGVAAGVAN